MYNKTKDVSCQSQEPGTYANAYQGKNSFFHACTRNTQYTAAGCNGNSYNATAMCLLSSRINGSIHDFCEIDLLTAMNWNPITHDLY